jgi:RIO kinase 1
MTRDNAEERPGRRRDDSDPTEHERGASPPVPADLRSLVTPDFATGVQVTDTERAWIRQHLGPFQENHLILDVVRRVKAGKEATVYACTGHPSTGRPVLAAKLYRERSLRSTKNAGQYQQGRGTLDEDGNAVRHRSWRLDKAIEQKTKRGRTAAQISWLMHEFTLLQTLHARGGDVPEPIEHAEHALLMEFIGDGLDAAPTLNDVDLDAGEAKRLFERVVFNIELMLELGWVHGDLSPYNLLYHRGRIVLIDFPQVVDCQNNPRARSIFERDIERVSEYFAGVGFCADNQRLARQLWSKYETNAAPGE